MFMCYSADKQVLKDAISIANWRRTFLKNFLLSILCKSMYLPNFWEVSEKVQYWNFQNKIPACQHRHLQNYYSEENARKEGETISAILLPLSL